MNPADHESGIDRKRLPGALREQIMAALQRGDDTYDDVLDAIEAHWPVPESIERRILITTSTGQGPEVHSEHDNESDARIELAVYRQDYPHHKAELQRREVGAWQSA